MTWEVRFRRGALKSLAALPPKDQSAIRAAIERVASGEGGDFKKMKAAGGRWRLRVGDYRIQ